MSIIESMNLQLLVVVTQLLESFNVISWMILMTVDLACSCGSSMIFDAKTRLITLDTTKPPEEKKAPRVWFTLLYKAVPNTCHKLNIFPLKKNHHSSSWQYIVLLCSRQEGRKQQKLQKQQSQKSLLRHDSKKYMKPWFLVKMHSSIISI